jgi:hypothetical protein
MTITRRKVGWIHTAIAGCATALLACGAASTTSQGAGGGTAGSGGGVGGGVAMTGGGAGGGVAMTGGGAGGGVAMTGGGAGGGAGVAMYPSWQLQDIQPVSPRFNQTYGLSAFAGRPVVAMLLEGF